MEDRDGYYEWVKYDEAHKLYDMSKYLPRSSLILQGNDGFYNKNWRAALALECRPECIEMIAECSIRNVGFTRRKGKL